MDKVISFSKPSLATKTIKQLQCPNCSSDMSLLAENLSAGNIIQCQTCSQKSYYPFHEDTEKPFFKKTSWWFYGLVLGVLSTFLSSYLSHLMELLLK